MFKKEIPKYGFKNLGGGNDDPDGDMTGMYSEYYLYNQNGFTNALYSHFGLDLEDPKVGIYGNYSEKKEIRKKAKHCYPEKYPCIMKIWSYHTFESGLLCAEFY